MSEDFDLRRASSAELENDFFAALKEVYNCVMNAFPGVFLLENGPAFSEESLRSISEWRRIFDSDVQHLKLDLICDKLMKTTSFAVSCVILRFKQILKVEFLPFLVQSLQSCLKQGELLNYYINSNPSLCSLIGAHLRHLWSLLDVILAFSDNLLHDFLTMHRIVSSFPNSSLSVFSKGSCLSLSMLFFHSIGTCKIFSALIILVLSHKRALDSLE